MPPALAIVLGTEMHFFLATVLILAAVGDVRILRVGMPRGGPRLARHLANVLRAVHRGRIVLLDP